MKSIYIILMAITLASCSYFPNYSPKVKARIEFESKVAKIYGSENARLIVKYDMFALSSGNCLISPLYTDPFNENISYNKYVNKLNTAYMDLKALSPKDANDIFYYKLKNLSARYNIVASKLAFTPAVYKPHKRSLAKMMRSLNNFHAKFKSVPIIPPTEDYIISSRYGNRMHPIDGVTKFHHGSDLVSGTGSNKIYAAADGKIVSIEKSRGYGNSVVIKHGNNIFTKYAHLSKIFVKDGRLVSAGQVIGIMGNTGKATNTHLHYEIKYNNRTLDPAFFLAKSNCQIN